MEDWKEYKLGDCVEAVIDNRGKSAPTKPLGEFPLLEINSIGGYYPNYSVIRKYVDKVTYSTWFRSGHPICGDILVPTVGTIGIISIMDNHKACIAQNLIALRTKKDISNIFIYYFLKSPIVKKQLINLDIGGVQPSIKVPHLLNLSISLPEKDIQHKIASILSSLDDKIEVNRKINENLEQQAQALFKSWFVDFEPFKDQPFVESELGMIPKGWRVGTLDEIGDVIGGSTPSKAKPEYYTDNGIAWLTPKDLSISNAKFTSNGEIDITPEGYNSCSTKLMPKGSVLFSSRAPIGYITIAKNEICTNQGFKSVVPGYAGTAFIYCYLKYATPDIENMATGSTFKEASGSLMKSLQVVMAPKEVLDSFEECLKPIFAEQECLEDESRRLAELRDTLLPRLMSGELKVQNSDLINEMLEKGIR